MFRRSRQHRPPRGPGRSSARATPSFRPSARTWRRSHTSALGWTMSSRLRASAFFDPALASTRDGCSTSRHRAFFLIRFFPISGASRTQLFVTRRCLRRRFHCQTSSRSGGSSRFSKTTSPASMRVHRVSTWRRGVCAFWLLRRRKLFGTRLLNSVRRRPLGVLGSLRAMEPQRSAWRTARVRPWFGFRILSEEPSTCPTRSALKMDNLTSRASCSTPVTSCSSGRMAAET